MLLVASNPAAEPSQHGIRLPLVLEPIEFKINVTIELPFPVTLALLSVA